MKNVVPVIIILILLLVGGYFIMKSKGPSSNMANIATGTKSNPPGNVFTSIQDALSKSMTLQCDYKNEQGVQTTTYVKGGAVRVIMTGEADKKQPNNIILKDKKMYMWSDVDKTGFTYTMTVPVVTPGAAATSSGQPPTGDKQASVLASVEKYKNSCKTAVVADSFFQVPTDVKFQDMSAFTQQLMKQVPSQPAGGQNPTDYQNYINQMKKQAGGQ